MTPLEKIEYVRKMIADRAAICPSGPIDLRLYDLMEYEEGPMLLSAGEQKLILLKLQEDREVHGVEWEGGERNIRLSAGPISAEREKAIRDFLGQEQILEIQTVSGTLKLNENTGSLSLSDVSGKTNPSSQEYKILSALMSNDDNQATYSELLNGNTSKVNIRNLGFTVRNLKKILGILPKKTRGNHDIFKNIKNYGYKLLVK